MAPPDDTRLPPAAGMTVREVARRYRVSPDKVRIWIRAGRLGALNTSEPSCKPRFVVLPHHLADFEHGRQVATLIPKPVRRPRRELVDFYPGD